MNTRHAMRYASALSLALIFGAAHAAGDDNKATSSNPQPMTGKQKATAIGATTGAVAGAVVGGPVGAVAGGVVGGIVGHEGTDANGKVYPQGTNGKASAASMPNGTVRNAQAALNDRGFDAGAVDGVWGPHTESAVRRFQSERGLEQSGRLDDKTLDALGVSR